MKTCRGLLCGLLLLLAPAVLVKAQDPITVIIQQGIKKVIVAVDLKIQRMQNEVIWLQNAQKVVENTLSQLRLDEISDWVQKQRDLYGSYFDELWRVKDLIGSYHKVREIIDRQLLMVKEYKSAWQGILQDRHFSAEERSYMEKVYAGILQKSLANLDLLLEVMAAYSVQMTDAKRLEIIDAAARAVQQTHTDLKQFNGQNMQLSLQRAKDAYDVSITKRLYGIQ
ncbi:MAG TPA: conjugal transfer protein TraI [Flavisolibacter sp.]|jgi:hypothetical protein|nr:conjugal transfer protein TraI [Flavisolibacter sp.]